MKKSMSWRWLALTTGVFWACIEIPDRSPGVAAGGTSSTNGGTGGSGDATSGGSNSGKGGSTSGGTTSGGTGGSDGSSGGSAGTGNAGGPGSAGEGGAGGSTGSTHCKTVVVAQAVDPADAVIDDFEDGDGAIFPRDGRAGSWFLTTDGTGSTTPLPGSVTPVDTGFDKGLMVSGSNFTGWGVDLAAPFVSSVDGCYDASAYTGIKLAAGGNSDPANNTYGTFYLSVFTAGVRAAPEGERNFHKVILDIDYGGIFVLHTVHWADLQQLGGWGTQVDFDPREIYGISVAMEGPDIEFAIDDVEFVTD